jgi:hypothetical protein
MSRTGAMLFFSVFLIAGLVATWFLLLRPLARVYDARQWPATSCTVVSSEVKSHSDSDGTTYSVHIVYRYTVNGRDYQSDRYNFMGGSSSGYNSKKTVVRRYPPGKPAFCYVNPRDPSDAVLERRFTPMMLVGLFPLIFVAVGAGGMIWAFTNKSFRKPIEGVPPWQSRSDWAEGRIVFSNKTAMLVLWVVTVIWNLVAWPVALMLMDRVLWVLVFPFIGVLLLFAAIRQTRVWQKFGETVFELATRPGAIGGALAGTLRLRQFVRFDAGMKLTLRCIRVESSGDSTTEHILWTDEQTVVADGTDAVPVNFYIPPECAETDAANRVLWRLEAKAADYATQFEVPVFKVAQDTSTAQKAFAAKQAAVAAYQRPADSPIRVEPSWRGGAEFHFPAGRNPVVAVGLTIFLAAWSGAIAAMIAFKAPIIFPIVFGLFDLIILAVVFGFWFSVVCATVGRDAVTITRTALGWRRERVVPVADIARFQAAIGMTAGTTVYYDIKLVRHNGKTETVGSGIQDKREADWLADEMARCAGITPASAP